MSYAQIDEQRKLSTYFAKKRLWLNHVVSIASGVAAFFIALLAAHQSGATSALLGLVVGLLQGLFVAVVSLQVTDLERAQMEIRDPSDDLLTVYRCMRSLKDQRGSQVFKDEATRRLSDLAVSIRDAVKYDSMAFDLGLDARMRSLQAAIVKEALDDPSCTKIQMLHFLGDNDDYFSNVRWQRLQLDIDKGLQKTKQPLGPHGETPTKAKRSEDQYKLICERLFIYDDDDLLATLKDSRSHAFIGWHTKAPYACRLLKLSQYRAIVDGTVYPQKIPPMHDFGIYKNWAETGIVQTQPDTKQRTKFTHDPGDVANIARLFAQLWEAADPASEFSKYRPVNIEDLILQLHVKPHSTVTIRQAADIYEMAAKMACESQDRVWGSNIRINPDSFQVLSVGTARAKYIAELAQHLVSHPNLDYRQACFLGPYGQNCGETVEGRLLEEELSSLLTGASSNVKVHLFKTNPVSLDVLIGDHEALLSVPTSRTGELRFALVVRNDPGAIEALQD